MGRWGSGRTAVSAHSVSRLASRWPRDNSCKRQGKCTRAGAWRAFLPGQAGVPARSSGPALLTAAGQGVAVGGPAANSGVRAFRVASRPWLKAAVTFDPAKLNQLEQRGRRATEGRGAPNGPMSQLRWAAGALESSQKLLTLPETMSPLLTGQGLD